MKLPSVKELSVAQKTVLLRTNYDVPLKDSQVADDARIVESLPTINYLLDQQAKVIIISHLGRPDGKVVPELSLKPVVEIISNFKFPISNEFFPRSGIPPRGTISKIKLNEFEGWKLNDNLYVLENLRFYPDEENNDEDFARNLANLGDFFVNDAFACSHRKHASIVGIPRFLPSAFGLDFLKEVEILDKIKNNPRRPVVVILGGVKKDKIDLAHKLINWADNILIGGKIIEDKEAQKILNHHNVVGALIKDKHDITMETIQNFRKIIDKAGTIIWAGPMGQYEEKRWGKGTKEIARAIIGSGAYTIVGGGDTEAALTKFGLTNKINYISSGGGAMLEFLAQGTLPGIEAIIKQE